MNDHSSGSDYVLVLDGGDFGSGSGEANELKTKYLLKGMSALKYDAINLGERDFLNGPEFLLTMKEEYNLPFISANIYYVDNETRFTQPYIIKELEGNKVSDNVQPLKVGIFGIMMKRSALIHTEQEPKLIAKDPIVAAEEVVNELREKCDLVVALAHITTTQINDLTSKVKGIDIVVGSHDFFKSSTPTKVNEAILIQTGAKGQYLGDLKITLDNSKNIGSYDGIVVKLDSEIKDDASIAKIVNEYDKEFNRINKNEQGVN